MQVPYCPICKTRRPWGHTHTFREPALILPAPRESAPTPGPKNKGGRPRTGFDKRDYMRRYMAERRRQEAEAK